jgi:hypothetical protein
MSLDDVKHRIFGGSARGAMLRLAIASIVVGVVLSILGIDPIEFWRGVWDGVRSVVSMLGENVWEVLRKIVSYLLLGAAIVVPIWFIARVLTGGRKSRRD